MFINFLFYFFVFIYGTGKVKKYCTASTAEENTKLYTGCIILTVFIFCGPNITDLGEFWATESPLSP